MPRPLWTEPRPEQDKIATIPASDLTSGMLIEKCAEDPRLDGQLVVTSVAVPGGRVSIFTKRGYSTTLSSNRRVDVVEP